MSEIEDRAIIVLGVGAPAEAVLAEAGRFANVFVFARALPTDGSRYLVDTGRAEARAGDRLRAVVSDLRGRGINSRGVVGDADRDAARRDAVALFPGARVMFEAA